MRVSVLINQNPFFGNSAAANRWLGLLQGLVAHGVQLHLYVAGGYQTASEKDDWGKQGVRHGIDYTYLSNWVNDSLWKRRFYIYFLRYFQAVLLGRQLQKLAFTSTQVLWVENDLVLWQIAEKVVSRNRHLRLFAEMNEFLDIHHFNIGNRFQKRLGDKTQQYFESRFFYALDGLALMTSRLVEHYRLFPGKKPVLFHLPMTVDFERFQGVHQPITGFEQPYVLFVGVMNDAKDGVNLLIEAFAQIAPDFENLKLYLVGPWNYDTPKHLRRIEELGLTQKIIWKGEMQRSAIPALVSNASLLMLPRPDSKQAQGGFPTKLGEYLASGRPVCATTVGEIPLYLKEGESVFFAEPGSVASLKSAMYRALSNKAEADAIALGGKAIAEANFNTRVVTFQLKAFLETLVKTEKAK